MSKPEDKKPLKEKLLSKLPKLPAFRLPDMKWAEKRAKVKAGWGKFAAASTSLWTKVSTWSAGIARKAWAHTKTGWARTRAFVKKYRADVIFTGVLLGSTYGMVSVMTYLSNPERNDASVTFREEGKDIVVYPEKKKLYVESGKEYFMADYTRKYSCEGVLGHMPRWLMPAENNKMYSMKMCSEFNGAVGDRAHLGEKIKKYEKYIELAQNQPPKP